MIVSFDKDGITTNCPNNLSNETQFDVCQSCRYFGGSYGFNVTCLRNYRATEEYLKVVQ